MKKHLRSMLRTGTSFPPLRWACWSMGRSGLLPEAVWARLPIERTFGVGLPDGQRLVYASIADDGVGRALYWRGFRGWEPETLGVFFSLARSARIVLDVGAFTGLFGILAGFASRTSRVVCFEPFPLLFDRLRGHIGLNSLAGRVEARNVAVSDAPGAMRLYVPASQAPAGASLRTDGLRGDASDSVEVGVTTLDDACADLGPPDLIKIDVEGVEDRVLRGMRRILAAAQPTLVIECLPDGPFAEVEAILRPHGYHFFHLLPQGPAAREHIEPDRKERYRNYLCSAEADWRALPRPPEQPPTGDRQSGDSLPDTTASAERAAGDGAA